MKKIICLTLAILVVFATMTVFASETDVSMVSGVRLSYDGVYYDDFLDGEGTINVNLKNKGAAESITFVVAEYEAKDGYRKLVQSKIQTLSIDANSEKPFEVKFAPVNVGNDFNMFAFCNSNVGSIYLGEEFVLDKYQYIGNSEDGAAVYKVNSFTDRVYDKFKYVQTEEEGVSVYRIDRFVN